MLRKKVAILIAMVVVAGLVSGTQVRQAAAQSKTSARRLTEAEAIALHRKLFDGMIAHDLKGLATILDKDLMYIHIGGDAQKSRDEFLSWVDTGPHFQTFDLTEPKVFLFDGAMALTGKVVSVSKVISKGPDGKEQSRDTVLNLVLSTVWAQKPEGWQMVLLQYTQIPDKK